MKLGIYGGTFDPPHIGHLIVAQDACEELGLDRVLFIPAGAPPHKRDHVITPAPLRLRMLEAAISGDVRFAIETLELTRPGPSYSVDTLEELSTRYPGAELFLLLGADQYREFHTWREPARVAALSRIAVLRRGDTAEIAAADMEVFRAQWVSVTRIDVSSTDIRRRMAAGQSVRFLVPDAVEKLLLKEGLYSAR
ncbi:MAG: nicotinate-nucleotide adenylyltransferase [Longimicrobiales bacterium]